MDKKKTSLIALISIGLVIVLGICFLKFGGQDRPDKRDEAQSVTATEPSAEPTTESVIEPTVEASIEPAMEPEEENQETGVTQEQQAEGEQREERLVLIVEDDGVRDNPTFAAFMDKDIAAYDDAAEKKRYIEETLAYMYGDYFEVEGVEVSADDFFAYIDPLAKAEQIERMDFTEEMLDKILLGDLEEEELSIVKHMKPETEDDNILQVAEIPIVYLRVLTGREEFLCATEEGEKYIVDGDSIKDPQGEEAYQILYFSVLDMEGDGEDELVLTCDGITLILHTAEGVVYGYIFDFWDEMGAIAVDGVFRMGYFNGNKCGKIVSFETDGCQIEPVEDYASDSRDRIRFYFFSKETVARWWNFVF